jgi:hypothetical protein
LHPTSYKTENLSKKLLWEEHMKETSLGYMGFTEGMIIGQTMPSYVGGMRQIDWDKLKEFIETNKNELSSVEAGLAEDWEYTSGEVWNSKDGYIKKADTYVYGASKWATPSVHVTFKDGEIKTLECWKLGENADDYFDLSE